MEEKGTQVLMPGIATTLDIEEVPSGAFEGYACIFVADVIKSLDTVDRGILDFALGRLGLPCWFRRVHFGYHAHVQLRFKLRLVLGRPGQGMGYSTGVPA